MKQRYTTFTAEELALEPDFIRWVQTDDPALASAWEQWLEDYPESARKAELARSIVLGMEALVPEFPVARKAALWEKIDQATPSETIIRPMKSRNRINRWAAAAAILLLVAGSWWAYEATNNTTIREVAGVGHQFVETLPDGSTVYANAVTSLEYSRKEWGDQRKLSLEGEAFFEVAKGERFVVETPIGSVEVLGTSFNVLARDETFEVICYTGKVRVKAANATIDLTPGQAAILKNGQLQSKAVTDQNDIAYRDQLHHFNAQPLSEVFKELERQYDIEVSCPRDIGERLYNGFFVGDDLAKAIESICWTMSLDCQVTGKQLLIKAGQE